MATRREFVMTLGSAAALVAAGRLGAQQGSEAPGATMEGDGYLPVRRLPRPASAPRITPEQRDAVERMIACPCPCTLDVFTCRTSMPCGFSPRLHADINALAIGGYSGDEILAAFEQTYGEKILMAPRKEGFNWVGWLAPFAAVGAGGLGVAALIRRWGERGAARASAPVVPVDASAEELAELEAAVRGDDR